MEPRAAALDTHPSSAPARVSGRPLTASASPSAQRLWEWQHPSSYFSPSSSSPSSTSPSSPQSSSSPSSYSKCIAERPEALGVATSLLLLPLLPPPPPPPLPGTVLLLVVEQVCSGEEEGGHQETPRSSDVPTGSGWSVLQGHAITPLHRWAN